MKPQFRRFQTRIIVLFLGLFTVVQVIGFISVYVAQLASAREQINSALEVGAGVFNRLVMERNNRLIEAARLLSDDFAFKSAYAVREQETVMSALQNNQARIGADLMMLVSMDGSVAADTTRTQTIGKSFEFPELIRAAENNQFGEASAIVFFGGRAYQMVVVPLLVPQPDAWICTGFLLDDKFAAELGKLTLSHVSLLRESKREWQMVASTLPPALRSQTAATLAKNTLREHTSMSLRLGDTDYVSLMLPLDKTQERQVVALLQRSLDEALNPVMRLLLLLAALLVTGLAVSYAIGILIARSVTRPVRLLVESAHKIEQGEYSHHADVRQQDEIGDLATAFNSMARGLEEKDRVRDLLGKVVSPAIARQLLSKKIELGGEELTATILFSDVRNFTSLCENCSPTEILTLVNAYLTKISTVIDAHGGVVDKYMGDAVMALFGVPFPHDDDPVRAVNTAMGMRSALTELNVELAGRGMPQLDIGIGINTGIVVAGNMGSPTRLNYTVIGDGVNLASRLEALTKRYHVGIVVGEATMAAVPGMVFRELDKVRVKGKNVPVTIHEPVGRAGTLSVDTVEELKQYHTALKFYRERDLARARVEILSLLEAHPGCRLYEIYLGYINHFSSVAMGDDWDGSFVLYDK